MSLNSRTKVNISSLMEPRTPFTRQSKPLKNSGSPWFMASTLASTARAKPSLSLQNSHRRKVPDMRLYGRYGTTAQPASRSYTTTHGQGTPGETTTRNGPSYSRRSSGSSTSTKESQREMSPIPTSPLENEVRGNLQLEFNVPNPAVVNGMPSKLPLREVRKVLLKNSPSELRQILDMLTQNAERQKRTMDILIQNMESQNKAIAVLTENLESRKRAMDVLTQNMESQKKSMAHSDLVLAKVMNILEAQEAEKYTPGTLSADPQATNNLQLASDAPKAVTISELLSSDPNYNEYRGSTSLAPKVRGGRKVSSEAAVAESRLFQAGPEQYTDESKLKQPAIPTLSVNTQPTTDPQLVSKVSKAAVVNNIDR